MNKKIFVNGVFDILHIGHIDLLSFAKQQGDHLTVALDTDERVRKNKGHDRPINTLQERMILMRSIRYVDDVKSFGSDDELREIIRELKPDVIVVGSDWKGKEIIGSNFAKQIIFFERIPNLSTTQKIQSILKINNHK